MEIFPKPETSEEKAARELIATEQKSYRATLTALQEKMQEAYDKTVLTLSGGAFGVSVVITKDLIGVNRSILLPILIVAWAFWILSMIAVLFSYSESAKKMAEMIEIVDGQRVEEKTSRTLNASINTLNRCSGAFFVIGLVAFTVFISINMSNSKPTSGDTETRGANVPAPTTTIVRPTK